MTSPNMHMAIAGRLARQLAAAGNGTVTQAQADMSAIYRGGGHSRDAVPDASAALAYALARMPATYAACVRSFDLVAQRLPDFAPVVCLDIGAGPGTATLAAASVWPRLQGARLVEPNTALADIAVDLLAVASTLDVGVVGRPALDAMAPAAAVRADLVTLSYVLAEQPLSDVGRFVASIIPHIGSLIVVVEPGTPAGYARILAAREALIAAGLKIVAPCPHAQPCPLPTGDWCHFSVRLQRTAAHMQLKDASVPFEDERFSFIAAVHDAAAMPAAARLIRPADIEKGFADLAVCATAGLETRRIRRRDAAAYKAAKRLAWGDEV